MQTQVPLNLKQVYCDAASAESAARKAVEADTPLTDRSVATTNTAILLLSAISFISFSFRLGPPFSLLGRSSFGLREPS